MANPAGDKGREQENRVVQWLRPIFPMADRDGTNRYSQDIYGVPFPIEAKHRKSWNLKEWIRKIRKAARDRERYPFQPVDYERWVIFARDDKRRETTTAIGDAVIVPLEFALELLEVWEREARDWIDVVEAARRRDAEEQD